MKLVCSLLCLSEPSVLIQGAVYGSPAAGAQRREVPPPPRRSDVLCLPPPAQGHPGPGAWQRLLQLLRWGSALWWGWLCAEVDSSAGIGAFSALQGAYVL